MTRISIEEFDRNIGIATPTESQQPQTPSITTPTSGRISIEDFDSNIGMSDVRPLEAPKPPSILTGLQRMGEASQRRANLVIKDVLGREITEEEKPTTFVGDLAFEAFKSTVGSEGIAGFLSQISKTLALPFTLRGAADIQKAEFAKQIEQQQIGEIIRKANAETDPEKKDTLLRLSFEAMKRADEGAQRELQTRESIKQIEEQTIPEINKLIGSAINTGLTLATLGTGSVTRSLLMKTLVKAGADVNTLAKTAKITAFSKQILPKIVENIALSEAFNFANNIYEERPLTEGIVAAGLVGGAIPVAGVGVGATRRMLNTKLPSRLINSIIKPHIERELNFSKNPGRGVVQEGITANTQEELLSKIKERRKARGLEIKEKIEPYSNIRNDISETLEIIQKEKARALSMGQEGQAYLDRVQNIENQLTKEFKIVDGKITEIPGVNRNLKNIRMDELWKLKQDIGEATTWTGQAFDKDINQLRARIYGAMKGKMNEKIPGLGGLNERYADLLNAEKAAQRQVMQLEKKSWIDYALKNRFPFEVAYLLLAGNWGAVGAVLAGELLLAGAKAGKVAMTTRIANFLHRLAPADRDAVLRGAPVIQNLWERISGREPISGGIKTPPIGLSLEDISKKGGKFQIGQKVKILNSDSEYEILEDFGASLKLKNLKTGQTPTIGKSNIVESKTKIAEKAYQGETKLTTKILEKLKGKTTTSKQEILDFTNAGDIKQAERDLFRRLLAEEGDKVNVTEFANKVKTELLPLKTIGTDKKAGYLSGRAPKYENISLPDELRGPVANYQERIYESPIKTSAGDVHFSGGGANSSVPNYFAHTRIEDLPTGYKMGTDEFVKGKYPNTTRRVIEIQSDLFQKGRLEGEASNKIPWKDLTDEQVIAEIKSVSKLKGKALEKQIAEELAQRKIGQAELSKLEPYRNTWHERVIREEVKQAAIDGKTKLQFPTGETAMKIEGLGQAEHNWMINLESGAKREPFQMHAGKLTPDKLKVGMSIDQSGEGYANSDWIITDVLGDGKFKAMPKEHFDSFAESKGLTISGEDLISYAEQHATKNFWGSKETFDISGKVDTENPIYKFYNKEVRKYLVNKYGAKEIVDPQGVSWIEISITPKMKGLPIEAFGVAPLLIGEEEESRKNSQPTKENQKT